MTTLLVRASLRYLLRHPAQLVLAVLGVAVGVAVVVGIDTAAASARRSFRTTSQTLGGAATHVIRAGTSGVPEELFARIVLDPASPPAAPIMERTLALAPPQRRSLDVLGVDPFSEAPFRAYTAAGSGFDAAALLRGGAWLSASTAGELGLVVGDRLDFVVGTETRSVAIGGLFEASDAPAASALADVALMDVSTAQQLLDERGRLSRIDLSLSDVATTRAAQRAQLDALLPPSCSVESASARAAALEGLTRAFNVNLSGFGFLALLVGVFLVYNTMTFAVVQRRALWGTLRALGATRGALFRVVCIEALAIGALGTVLGVALGVLLARALIGPIEQTINDLYYAVDVHELALEPLSIAKAFALGVGATLVGAALPAFDATRATPRLVLDRAAPESRLRARLGALSACGAFSIVGALALLAVPEGSLLLGMSALVLLVLGFALLVPVTTIAGCRLLTPLVGALAGRVGRIAVRGVTSRLARCSVAIAALAVALAATAAMGIVVESFRGTVARWLDDILVADVYVSGPSQHSNRDTALLAPQFVERMLATSGAAEASLFRDLELDVVDGTRVFALAAQFTQRSRDVYRFISGDASDVWSRFEAEDVLIISEALARHRGLAVGDALALRSAHGPRSFRVVGVIRDYASDQGYALLSRTSFRRSWNDAGITALGLFLTPEQDGEIVARRLRASLEPGEVARIRTSKVVYDSALEVFERTFAVTEVVRLLSCIVAILGVVGALLAIELEREREMGVLRALGASPRSLALIVLGQSGVLGTLAGVIALPLGVALALVLILVVNTRAFGWTLEVDIGAGVLLQTFALALASALVAGLYPALRTARMSPARALRGE